MNAHLATLWWPHQSRCNPLAHMLHDLFVPGGITNTCAKRVSSYQCRNERPYPVFEGIAKLCVIKYILSYIVHRQLYNNVWAESGPAMP